MNPEFLRNLWLEATPFRLAAIAGLLLLVFAAASMGGGPFKPESAGLVLYWFFVVLWGTRSAALSVVGEIRERTWDGQKLSVVGPFEMVWGKLLGATIHNWYGGLICLPFILWPLLQTQGLVAAATYGLILVTLGVLAQAVALLSSLILIRRRTGNWRLDTFLCQVAGILAAFSHYSLWSTGQAFLRNTGLSISWWGQEFNLTAFHLVSLLLFTAWALVGCWRTMRAELRFTNGPFIWLAWLVYSALYQAGFESFLGQRFPQLESGVHSALSLRLGLAGLALLASTYSMVFLEPKDPVRLRWLVERVRAGGLARVFLALDAWMLSYAATVALGILLFLSLTGDGFATGNPAAGLPVIAMLGFLARDIGIFVLMRGGKRDLAAVAILGALYLLVPLILNGIGGAALVFAFVPVTGGSAVLSVIAAWVEGGVLSFLAIRSVKA